MSVYKPKNSPFFHFDFQLSGHRFHGSTGERTRRRAEQVETDERRRASTALKAGSTAAEVTLNTAAGEYWQSVARHQSSADTTEYQIANLIRILGAAKPLSAIRDAEVADYVRHRRGEESARSRQRRKKARRERARAQRERRNDLPDIPAPAVVSPATVNREIELLSRIIRRAARTLRAVLPPEPDRPDWKIHKLAEADPPDRPLTADQERRLYAELVEHAKPIVDVALLTGLRRGEVLQLDCRHIDFAAGKGRVRRKSKKHGGAWFTFDITEPLLAVLAPHVDGRTEGPVWRYGPPCTCARCTRPINHGAPIRSIRTAFEGARRRAGIPDFRIHDLRHTFGSRVMMLTGNLKAAQDMLGHKDISTTIRYAHHAPNALADVQRALGRMRDDGENSRKSPGQRDTNNENTNDFKKKA
jgi:integrase